MVFMGHLLYLVLYESLWLYLLPFITWILLACPRFFSFFLILYRLHEGVVISGGALEFSSCIFLGMNISIRYFSGVFLWDMLHKLLNAQMWSLEFAVDVLQLLGDCLAY